VKHLLFLTVLIIALASCEKPNDPNPSFSFNGTWENYNPEPTNSPYSYHILIDDNKVLRFNYIVNGITLVTAKLIDQTFDGEELTLKGNYSYEDNMIYFLAKLYFTDSNDELWMMINKSMDGYPNKLDSTPIPLTRVK